MLKFALSKTKHGMERWKRNNTCVYNLGFHIIWCPKYRRSVLKDGVDKLLKTLLLEKAEQREWTIEQMEVMSDHVHLFIRISPTDSIAYVVAQLKGYTSHGIRQRFPELWKRLPSLWTRSYYVESCGSMSEEKIKKYIENQKYKANSSNG